jgi:hypothetical protein
VGVGKIGPGSAVMEMSKAERIWRSAGVRGSSANSWNAMRTGSGNRAAIGWRFRTGGLGSRAIQESTSGSKNSNSRLGCEGGLTGADSGRLKRVPSLV